LTGWLKNIYKNSEFSKLYLRKKYMKIFQINIILINFGFNLGTVKMPQKPEIIASGGIFIGYEN
jgi:hypothetical protein